MDVQCSIAPVLWLDRGKDGGSQYGWHLLGPFTSSKQADEISQWITSSPTQASAKTIAGNACDFNFVDPAFILQKHAFSKIKQNNSSMLLMHSCELQILVWTCFGPFLEGLGPRAVWGPWLHALDSWLCSSEGLASGVEEPLEVQICWLDSHSVLLACLAAASNFLVLCTVVFRQSAGNAWKGNESGVRQCVHRGLF